MLLMTWKMKKYSKDGLVVFDPEYHTYHLGEKRLESVTRFIERFKNKFDTDKIAEHYARKHGLIKEEVLKKWEEEGRIACENGHAVHSVFENYIKYKEIIFPGKHGKEQVAEKFIKDFFHTNRLTPVEAEMIVYNSVIASQIDCIAKNPTGEYFVLDWKTNKEIKWESFNKFMLEPYQVYPDSSFFHYSMQLSIYKKLCTEYPIKDCFIVHIGMKDYKIHRHQNIEVDFRCLENLSQTRNQSKQLNPDIER